MRRIGIALVLAVLALLMLTAAAEAAGASKSSLKLEKFDAGFFSISKPVGWKVYTAGRGSTFSFVIRDPSAALRQVFLFGEVGPIYMSAEQKMLDQQYVMMGGYPSPWLDMPVVSPLTPGNFVKQFGAIARTQIAQSFISQCPTLDNVQIVCTKPSSSPIPGGTTEVVRAVFTQNNKLGQGLFAVTVAPLLPYSGSPGGGVGYGFLFVGISAPKDEFPKMEGDLTKCLQSFYLSKSYVRECMAEQAEAWRGVMKAGNTLRETSDIITKGWESRSKTHDILAEKYSDTILGTERLYDPGTGKVYEFENGFYDQYKLNPEDYNLSALKPLPGDNHDLWMKPQLDGGQYVGPGQ